eukprot:TRINITY_DN31705_c0_g2_i1.p5 TRINITY_DN31705_c0_g2~~TRINITY_DN31705_c0_g2_i1.p5  ORF type:complete len:122 (-),score=22.76 TRINITY_DN31705_c0_g2_i1:136-501(-)
MSAGDASPLARVLQAMSRPTRLIRGKDVDADAAVDEALFDCDEERALSAAAAEVRQQLSRDMGVSEWLAAMDNLVEPVDAFFTNVFVMAEDETVRRNRLALVRDVAQLSNGVLDLAELPGF